MIRDIKIDLELQPYIPHPPVPMEVLYERSCSNDRPTLRTWRDVWIKNVQDNHAFAGNFAENGLGKLFNSLNMRPCIVAGAGPSLANNIELLKDRKGIPLISCLHNFHYMEDNGCAPEYYVTLDAQDVTLEEVAEGGKKSLEEYLEISKDRTLLAFIGASPKLIKSWKGKIVWYTSPIPDQAIMDAFKEVEPFHTSIGTGGNVLGACFYIAKAIMGANPIVFIGADFCFSYDNKFHAWDSKYDRDLGQYIRAVDIYGNTVKTWQSYYNFKCWFDNRVSQVPGLYINASEGGIFGAYREGNIAQITQMPLKNVIDMYGINESIRQQCEVPTEEQRVVLF
jgi:hypothetical protein